MKKSIKLIISMLIGLFLGISIMISYAVSYNSEEISYDTSVSGAVQANVKDALDFLYNKTKSGASSECPENMSCVEKPGVVMSVTGPGSVDKGTVYVGIGETNTFTVTPNEGYTLHNIECNNDYTVSGFGTHPSDTTNAPNEQTVTLTNPNTANGGTCTITFGAKYVDIDVSSQQLHSTEKSDICNNNGEGCVCWYIKNGGSDFTYGSHTGCNFENKICKLTHNDASINCDIVSWAGNSYIWTAHGYIVCSGTLRCAT